MTIYNSLPCRISFFCNYRIRHPTASRRTTRKTGLPRPSQLALRNPSFSRSASIPTLLPITGAIATGRVASPGAGTSDAGPATKSLCRRSAPLRMRQILRNSGQKSCSDARRSMSIIVRRAALSPSSSVTAIRVTAHCRRSLRNLVPRSARLPSASAYLGRPDDCAAAAYRPGRHSVQRETYNRRLSAHRPHSEDEPLGRTIARLMVNPCSVVDRGIIALRASWAVIRKIVMEMPPSNRDREVPVHGTHVRAISGLRNHRWGTGSGQSDKRKRD
jgi:hypothetical protein